jgi:hypothetical protein
MNERDVPKFDLQGVKSILVRFNDMSEPVLPLCDYEINDLAKQIIEYAARCCVIDQQSTMK